MKTYKYWKKESAELRAKDGKLLKFTALGRSNSSESDASSDAKARLRKVEAMLGGAELEPKGDYTADIKEEVVKELDAKNVVTRNRYGALVLNSETCVMIDIDNHRKGFLETLGFKKRKNKPAIIEDLEKLAARPEYADLGFRIYETFKGVRLIITGAYCEPGERGLALMRACHSDPLFTTLCVKQKCYRARLTPKPHRVKQPGIKYKWPLEGAALAEAPRWIPEYERRSKGYAVCRYVKTLGRQDMPDRVVKFHDAETRADSGLPLA